MAAAASNADLGQRAWRLSSRLRAPGNLLARIRVDVAAVEGLTHRGIASENRGREAGATTNAGRAGFGGRELSESVRLASARAHLCLPLQPFLHGSHRRVPVPQLPWHRPEMLSGASANCDRNPGLPWQPPQAQPDSADDFRGVRGAVLLTQHSDLFYFSGSNCRIADLFAGHLGFPSKNGRDGLNPARPSMANRSYDCDLDDRSQRWAHRLKAIDGCTL